MNDRISEQGAAPESAAEPVEDSQTEISSDAGEAPAELRMRAAKAYAKNQGISTRGARTGSTW